MGGRLEGKTALVTAAGQGIGRATALAFAREGARVTATDIDQAKLVGIERTPGIAVAKLDVTDAGAVGAIAQKLGRVDALVNVAGFVHNGTILESADRDWAFAWSLNVLGMVNTIKALLPAMLAGGGGASGGSIVNIASVAGSLKGVPNRCVYGTTKAAVIGLSKSVAADFVGRKIRCNAVCPGTVQTPSLDERIGAFADPVEARKAFVARQPMGRLGNAEEIAEMCVYLASDAASFITGQTMIIDGGMTV